MLYETLDHSDDIVLMLHQTGADISDLAIASANDAFCRTSGYSQAELIGRPLHSLCALDWDPARWSTMVRAARERGSSRSEMLCNKKNGAAFWFGLHLMLVRGSAPPHFVVLGRDITESLQARQQQAAVQGLLAKVFLCVKAAVGIVSEHGIIQMANPALDELLGYPPGQLVGKVAVDLVAPGCRAAVVAARERQIAGGDDYTIATRLIRGDGTEMAAEVTSITVQREDLRRFRIITVLRLPEEVASVTVKVAGKIRLIGLDEVKEALGSRWNAVAARALASAEHVIRRRCGPRDTYSRTPDGGFLICFGDSTEDEASFRAAMIAREIKTKLIGEGETEGTAHVSGVAAAVNVPEGPDQSADKLAAAINERLNGRLTQIETQARETLRQTFHVGTCRLEPVRSTRSKTIVSQFVTLPKDIERRLQAAYSALPVAEREDFDYDRLVLGVAAERAISEIAAGGTLLMLVNVDFEAFLDRRRAERYVAACQALDARLRQRLVLILSNMPKGLPRSRVLECVLRVRPLCYGVGFQSDGMDVPAVEHSLLASATVVLQCHGQPLHQSAEFGRLIDVLHTRQAHVLVRRVASWLDVQVLDRAGANLVALVEDERDAPTGSSA
jgi:PAS domain S-box-containing protein